MPLLHYLPAWCSSNVWPKNKEVYLWIKYDEIIDRRKNLWNIKKKKDDNCNDDDALMIM